MKWVAVIGIGVCLLVLAFWLLANMTGALAGVLGCAMAFFTGTCCCVGGLTGALSPGDLP